MKQEKVVVELVVDRSETAIPEAETGLESRRPDHSTASGILLVLLAIFGFSLMDALAKYLNRFYPAPGLVWARYTVHMLLMIVLFGRRLGLDLVRTPRPGLQILRGMLLMLSTVFFFFALRFLPLAEAVAIGFISPALIMILSVPLLGEKISRRRWIAVGAGLLGVVIILRPGGGLLSPAAGLPLCAAACFSVYQIITRKLSHSDNPYATLFYTALVGTIALSVVVPFWWRTPTYFHAFLIVVLGLLGGFGHFFMIKALSQAPASLLAPFFYTQLVWAMLLGWAVFGEFPDGWAFVGMLVIMGSGLFVAYGERLHLHRVKESPGISPP